MTQRGGRKQVAGHRARKRFGQHFLTDRAAINQIVEQIDPQPEDRVIEIGPGLGALTGPLLDRLRELTVIELDRDLATRLRQQFDGGRDARLNLIEADALRVDWMALTAGGQARLVGNLPYNISTPLLVRLIDCCAQVSDQHFMLQREVVQRIVASRGSDYGRLGILLQAYYQCESVIEIAPEAFSPPPRVQSAVVRMRRLDQPRVRRAADLQAVLAAAFGQRRKMLRTTLLPWLARHQVVGDEIEPTARAENIPADTYYELSDRLTAVRSSGC